MAEVLCVYREVQVLKKAAAKAKKKTSKKSRAPVAIISYDEKPGIQAIATTAPDLPPVPGTYATFSRDNEYKRHGTLSLLAGIDLLTGKVHALVRDRHRSREFIEFLKLLDELSAAVAISDQGVDLPGEKINPGQQAERAMALVLVVAREGRVGARHGWQIRCRRRDRLDSRLFVVGDDRHRRTRFLRLGSSLLQDLNLAIDAQNLRHLRFEIGIATFQVVAHLVRLDLLLAKDLAHRALDQVGKTFVPRRRSVLARMAGQQPRRPQLVGIAVL